MRSPEPVGPLDGARVLPRLAPREFKLFRNLILDHCGIKLKDSKRLLLQNRIGKRLRALGFDSFRKYYLYLTSVEGNQTELRNLWSAITTNETHFFREPHHFEILRRWLLPEFTSKRKGSQTLRVWSAGCSTGQEPFTLAMVLDDWLEKMPQWEYSVTGTDIDARVIDVAKAGRYPLNLRREVPANYSMKYLNTVREEIHINPGLRKHVSFRCQNLCELKIVRPKVDLIFCRNVLMYLHADTRLRLVEHFQRSLVDDGYLILGSSESLHGLPRLFGRRRFGKTIIYPRDPGQEVRLDPY